MGGVVADGHEMDTPANERWCCNKRHGEDGEVIKTMVTTTEDTAGIGTVAAAWENEDDKTG